MMRRLAWCGTSQSISSGFHAVGCERGVDGLGHAHHGVAEHLPAFHADMPHGAGRGRATVDVESVVVAAIGIEMGREHAAFDCAVTLGGLQHHRAGTVSEQDTGRPVLPVENARKGLRADHQCIACLTKPEKIIGDRKRIDEARADGLHIEGRALTYIPSRSWIRVAVAGKVSSGVAVAQMMRSRSAPDRRAMASASSAALTPRSEVSSLSSATRRSRMPVRWRIHSSVVSTRLASSALVTTRDGR